MSGSNRLGPVVGMWHMQESVIAWARAWLPDYLEDSCRAHGVAADYVARPAEWNAIPAEEAEAWPNQKLPAFVPGIPGTVGDPARRGEGLYNVTWRVTLAAIVRGISENDTDLQASVYGAALAQMGLQQMGRNDEFGLPDLTVEGKTWRGLTFPVLGQADRKYTLAPSASFEVTIREGASGRSGLSAPRTPPLGDPGPYSTADTVNVDLALQPAAD